MRALILIEGPRETSLTRLLNAMGVVFKKASLEQAVDRSNAFGAERCALIIAEDQLAKAHEVARSLDTKLSQLFTQFACALVFPMQGTPVGAQALSEWTGGKVEVKRIETADRAYSVARLNVCSSFAGLQVSPNNPATDLGVLFDNTPFPVEHLIRIGELGFFTKISLPGTELFVIGTSAIFDVEAEVTRNLNAAACFCGLVPLILFLRHSEVPYWRSPCLRANVVIDDPTLKPNYGFVNFQKLAACVDELRCAVSIGFIPWNHMRTSPEVVELIRLRWPRLSLAIHGCDHTGSEFSTRTVQKAQQLVALSVDRMHELSARTGLYHDKVMVFPQGQFSGAAMQALRHSGLLGAVNTELIDRQIGHGVRARELLKPAITCYGGFPLFLRRPADEPIANFALDLLLGKPCVIVTHHEYYRRGMQALVSLVHALNTLVSPLEWTNLESVVSKAISVRANPDKTKDVRLFSAVTEVAAQDLSGLVRFSKVEPLPGKCFRAIVGGVFLACTVKGEHLNLCSPIGGEAPVTIEVKVSPLDQAPPITNSLKHRVRTAARRYLSEFRDNYVAKSSWMTAALSFASNVIHDRTALREARRTNQLP